MKRSLRALLESPLGYHLTLCESESVLVHGATGCNEKCTTPITPHWSDDQLIYIVRGLANGR